MKIYFLNFEYIVLMFSSFIQRPALQLESYNLIGCKPHGIQLEICEWEVLMKRSKPIREIYQNI